VYIKAPADYDLTAIKTHVEQTFDCPVAAVLPHSDEMMNLSRNDIFALRYPDHPLPAALRGVAAQGVSSLVVNEVLKRVFGRVRPDMANLRSERTLRRAPGTLSFPSGHSSSAAAFVTGVGLEAPSVGAVLAPVALGVGYSRVHVGVHYPGDVVAGLAIGTAVGLAAAWGLSRVLAALLYGVEPHDPATFAVVPLLMLPPALVATLLPALRATRVNAIEVMRGD